MKNLKRVEQINKLLAYALGIRPDEFGLVCDEQGWFEMGAVERAINEQEDAPRIRRGAILEAVTILGPAGANIEIDGEQKKVRAKAPEFSHPSSPATDLPVLLYTATREKTWPVIFEKGIFPAGFPQVILSPEKEMAVRLGRRIAPFVLLTVNTDQALEQGASFYSRGPLLFVTGFVPATCVLGPPLPKEKPQAKKAKKPEPAAAPPTWGSFSPDPATLPGAPQKPPKGRQKRGWKEEARKQRRKGG
jgi:putative RNA 2'-phosphotransferase